MVNRRFLQTSLVMNSRQDNIIIHLLDEPHHFIFSLNPGEKLNRPCIYTSLHLKITAEG